MYIYIYIYSFFLFFLGLAVSCSLFLWRAPAFWGPLLVPKGPKALKALQRC